MRIDPWNKVLHMFFSIAYFQHAGSFNFALYKLV